MTGQEERERHTLVVERAEEQLEAAFRGGAVSELKVGDTVWHFDYNRRVYAEPQPGHKWGELIHREHWRKVIIVAETSRSWVTDYYGKKLPKNGSWPHGWVRTEQEVDDSEWLYANRYKLGDAVRACQDVNVLRDVARLVGYEPMDA